MIYLSGAMQAAKIGLRKDIGVMLGFRPKKDFMGKWARMDKCLWAADNGCFTNPNLNVDDFLKWLEQMKQFQETCLFAVAPDVVGDPVETWKRSAPVLKQIRAIGYEAAFVAQDGQENLPVHWEEFDCLFIGGSTEWKCSDSSFYLIREACKRGKWVHVGRVNSMRRILWARYAGAHSCDGTTIASHPTKSCRKLKDGWTLSNRNPFLIFKEMIKPVSIQDYRRMTNAERREPKAKRATGEHDHQSAYFDVLKLNYREFPFLRFIFAVPNAAKRNPQVAAILKAEGLVAGVWDLHLPFARRGYGAAWIENKFGDNKLSPEQIAFGEHFRSENFFTKVSYSLETSLEVTEWYLGIELKK